MKLEKTINRRITTLENRVVKFEADKSLDSKLVKPAVKRIKKEIATLKWVLK